MEFNNHAQRTWLLNSLVKEMAFQPLSLATPGIFLFLPYLNRLKIFEKASSLMNLDPDCGYSWFSLLLCNLGRILGGISSAYKACRINELSIPIASGLVAMPSKESLLNGLAAIEETHLLEMRQYLTQISSRYGLVEGKSIAFDFKNAGPHR